MSQLVRNAIKTPDGTVLESHERHDYKTYVDTKTNKEYMVDGGLSYCRRSTPGDEEDLNVYLEDGHEKVRETFSWGTYGKDGKGPYSRVLLKDMNNGHIGAVLSTQTHIPEWMRGMFIEELEYREDNDE